MSMRDYEDLKDIEIPRKQEMMMDIMCKAWEECRELRKLSGQTEKVYAHDGV